MKLYSEKENYKLYQGSMLDMLEVIDKESIDCVITDPPYGLTSITKRFGKEGSVPASTKNNDGSFARLSRGFMGKEWDGSGVEYNIETWRKCFDVLKDGGYLLAFGGSRTFHRIACAIEDAGFEIRDTIMWLYGSGFPKSMDISKQIDKKLGAEREVIGIRTFADGTKARATARAGIFSEEKGQSYLTAPATDLAKQWQGWGTCLKPSFEPIIIARKPFKGSLIDNVIENGVGGLNIDECRIGMTEDDKKQYYDKQKSFENTNKNLNIYGGNFLLSSKTTFYDTDTLTQKTLNNGRFPANTILTYDETDFDEVCGGFPYTKNSKRSSKNNKDTVYTNTYTPPKAIYTENNTYGDSGSASRYFYCAKASKKDRDEGLEEFEIKGAKELLNRKENSDGASWNGKYSSGNAYAGCGAPKKNTHPTVKPTELMQYLVRLVAPKGATILDPFMGSGSTGKAVMYENKERDKDYKFIGIELTEEYLPIAQARIDYAINKIEEKDIQMTIFDKV